ncbi:MAG: DoxX family protein [Rhodospirillales bacterium]|nr:DoxX family protein [Rhodospirillales bacterium]
MNNSIIDAKTAPYGALVLRVSLGIMFLAHSLYLKVMVFTVPGTVQYFESLGLPGFSTYLVLTAEILGGIALILGLYTRPVAFALVPVLLGALWVHSGNGWVFSAKGGGWEYPLFLTLAAIVQGLLGDGAYSVKGRSTNEQTGAEAV